MPGPPGPGGFPEPGGGEVQDTGGQGAGPHPDPGGEGGGEEAEAGIPRAHELTGEVQL